MLIEFLVVTAFIYYIHILNNVINSETVSIYKRVIKQCGISATSEYYMHSIVHQDLLCSTKVLYTCMEDWYLVYGRYTVYKIDEVRQHQAQLAHDHLGQLSPPPSRGQFTSTNASSEINIPKRSLKSWDHIS